MALLGGLLVWLLLLAGLAGLCAYPVILAWHAWTRASRAHRAAHQPPRQPYDDAYERALWERATSNGWRDAHRHLDQLH